MRSKLKSRLPYFLLSLIVTVTIPEGNGQYNNYPVYSTLSHGGESSNSNSGSPSGGSLDGINKNVDLSSSNGVSGDLSLEQSQRVNQVVGYTNPQDQGSMHYYQIYPQNNYAVPKVGQTCTYTSKGTKCYYRRDGSYGGWGEPATGGWGEPATGGWGMEEEEKGGSSAGLAGLIGLLGLKGLKSLLPFSPLTLALPLLPILLPLLPLLPILLPLILLAPLLPILLPLLLLFIPIPVVVGRNLGLGENKALGLTYVSRMASDVLESEECVERIACEVVRVSKKFNASSFVEKLANNLPKDGRYTARVQKGISNKVDKESTNEESRVSSEHGSCTKFACSPGSVLAKHLGSKQT